MQYTNKQIKRIIELKKDGLSWADIAREFNREFGTNKSKDTLLKKYENTISALSCEITRDDTTLKSLQQAHSQKKRNALLRKQNKIILDHKIEFEDFLKELNTEIKQIKFCKAPPKKFCKNKKTDRVLVAHISDTHFGCIVKKNEVRTNEYNIDVAKHRMQELLHQIVNYKPEHRKNTELHLIFNGDILHGCIHNIENHMNMTQQFVGALEILIPFISTAALRFKKVTVTSITGNHDRLVHRHKQRATEQKWDSYQTMLFKSIEQALIAHKNIFFNIPKTPYAHFKIFDHNFFATHGDTVLKSGNVHHTLSISKIKNQIYNLQNALGKIDCVMLGHVHRELRTTLPNCVLLVNGTLSGVDGFAQSIGQLNNLCIQQIFEVTREYIVGDYRAISLA